MRKWIAALLLLATAMALIAAHGACDARPVVPLDDEEDGGSDAGHD